MSVRREDWLSGFLDVAQQFLKHRKIACICIFLACHLKRNVGISHQAQLRAWFDASICLHAFANYKSADNSVDL